MTAFSRGGGVATVHPAQPPPSRPYLPLLSSPPPPTPSNLPPPRPAERKEKKKLFLPAFRIRQCCGVPATVQRPYRPYRPYAVRDGIPVCRLAALGMACIPPYLVAPVDSTMACLSVCLSVSVFHGNAVPISRQNKNKTTGARRWVCLITLYPDINVDSLLVN